MSGSRSWSHLSRSLTPVAVLVSDTEETEPEHGIPNGILYAYRATQNQVRLELVALAYDPTAYSQLLRHTTTEPTHMAGKV